MYGEMTMGYVAQSGLWYIGERLDIVIIEVARKQYYTKNLLSIQKFIDSI